MSRTDAILKRLSGLHPKLIDLSLDRILPLLEALGNPHQKLPPVIHVAGTNAKGSTIAYLRAFLEAAGQSVHVYNSPHLVRFNERIRLGGKLVSTPMLDDTLERVEQINAGRNITLFEITTAAAFVLYAEAPADYLLLETGLGGTYDTTNVVQNPLGVVITPVDLDHQGFLGNTIAEIAVNKAGILKRGSKAVIGIQQEEGRAVIDRAAQRLGITPLYQGEEFHGAAQDGRLVYQDEAGLLDLPPPALLGAHQFENAALAIAATRHFGLPVNSDALARGLRNVVWPARMMPLKGKLRDQLGAGAELWLDGGHNVHGARAIAHAIADMNRTRPAPLILIMGMMNNRSPAEFLEPFKEIAQEVVAVAVPGEPNAHTADAIATDARAVGLPASTTTDVEVALAQAARTPNARVLICGSLYLAGDVLARNGTPPD
ncbi:bifunctional folylpolyglutamate synthase/dihydrofolate synthase [Devosia submarina]|uniref:bifunctional folylpolyglutamate synthase/dihydrofolate synthase n=1 Tax=Devosia submarina TaxID=1173082 RepID=UPI000D3B3EAF|nr:folylpolyglutamate synthase/dihydrofolate synthase family protein [Devosia submarina]